MVEQSDTVVTYVVHAFGGASQYMKMAQNRAKYVINLPDLM